MTNQTKPKIYWARPITTYSRTHLQKLQAHFKGERVLQDKYLRQHQALYEKYLECETKAQAYFNHLGYDIIDPGSQEVAEAFEKWRAISDKNKGNPMPFFTKLCETCEIIGATPFDDNLQANGVPNHVNRLGCGVVKEINSVVNRKNSGDVILIIPDQLDVGLSTSINNLIDWNKFKTSHKLFICLDYPQTKALLVLEGYVSQSSKYKDKQK